VFLSHRISDTFSFVVAFLLSRRWETSWQDDDDNRVVVLVYATPSRRDADIDTSNACQLVDFVAWIFREESGRNVVAADFKEVTK